MKILFVNRNEIVLIFAAMLLIYGVQGVGYAQDAPDTTVEFKDIILARIVRNELRLPTGDGVDLLKIPKAELEKLTGLTLRRVNVTDFTGLEHATQLTGLDLSHNQIRDLTPLAELTQLTSLNLQRNNVSDITSLAELTQLRDLNLTDNKVSDITPLAELTQLTSLNLYSNWSKNNVSDLTPLAQLTQLTSLNLVNNNVSDITPLAELTQLTSLNLRRNHIIDITPLAELIQLMWLNLADNQISDIAPLTELTQLRELYLGENSISDITSLARLTQLRVLNLSKNRIRDVTPLVGLISLKELRLEGNPIWSTYPLNALLDANPKIKLDVRVTDAVPFPMTEKGVKELRVLSPELQGQPMFWVNTDTGKIESSEYFDAITQEVTVLTVDRADGKLYWGERSKSGGVIKRADFDGINVEALITLSSVPRGIVVDSVRNKLYWTNSDLQIQTATLNGEDIRTVTQLEEEILEETQKNCSSGGIFWLLVIPISYGGGCSEETIRTNLTSPTDIAVNTVDGRLYWTEFSGRIRRVNLDGTELDTLLSDIGSPYGIIVVDNKVYWAEEIDDNSGKIQRANPNGTNVETLAKVQGLPTGISVDTAAGKIYWANSLGGIQRTNIDGGEVEVVVSGITSPGDFVLVQDAQSTLPAAATTDAPELTELKSDVNGDGIVNLQDLVLTALNYGQTGQNPADVNGDGIVNIEDLILVAGVLDANAAAPSLHPQSLEMLTATDVKQWLSAGQKLDLTDATSQRGILFLQQLLIALTPTETTLLPNYPNPFNPETWIPYQLAKDAEVTLHIYAVNGALVRTLTLGHQPAGIYQSRSRAAYWNGRNAFGEPVASGVYFYTLEAGDFIATRKMLIRK